ncbi:MAG: MFS transporter [Chthoniobacterales bacterium]|nr:MFS transporter [Chthoniobacterales bacterium]
MQTTETARVPEELSGRQRRIPVGKITWRHTFRAMRHRNYRLFFYGQLVSLTGTWMQQTAMSWLVYEMTGSKFLLGVISAVGSAPMMIFSLWGGSLADRYPKRSILLVTQVFEMVFAFLLAATVWMHLASPTLIMIIAAVNGIALGFEMPSRQAFTVEMTSREDLLNAISLNSSIFNGARILGPSLAGLLIGTVGTAMCFFLNGVSFVAVIVGYLMMRVPAAPANPDAQNAHPLSGIKYAVTNRRVRTILGLFGVVGVFGWSYAVLMPAFARDVLGLGPNGYGVIMSTSGIGALVGALAVATYGHAVSPRKMALGGVWIFSAAVVALAFTSNFWSSLVLLFVSGFGMLLFFSTSNTVLQTIVPDNMRGRVMGVWSLIFGAMIPIGSLQAGAVAHWLGTSYALALGAVICAVAALWTLLVIRRRDAESARTS